MTLKENNTAISLSVARGTIAFEPRRCVPHLLRQSQLGPASLCKIAHYYIIKYSHIVLIKGLAMVNLNVI